MDIIQRIEIYALELENDGYFEKAERLRQGVSKILSKDVNKNYYYYYYYYYYYIVITNNFYTG